MLNNVRDFIERNQAEIREKSNLKERAKTRLAIANTNQLICGEPNLTGNVASIFEKRS
jgi:hypothetical protein